MLFLYRNRNPSVIHRILTRALRSAPLVLLMLALNWAMPALHAQEQAKSKRPHAEAKRFVSKGVAERGGLDDDSGRNLQSKPASVTLADGQLTVTAENSDLAQILGRVSRLSGMKVSGSGAGAHVFGVYGPGDPQTVLTKLLTGSGYNFMMVGRTAVGAPRKLLLMARSDAPEPTRPAASQPVASGGENAQQGQEMSPARSSTPDQEPLGPGALAHVPPSEQQANQESPQTRMQQHLQQLQQQYQERQQQQPQQ